MKKIKVMSVVGTRPEIIRLSRVLHLLDKYTNHVSVHTGQNYDYELNEIFYKDLQVRKPDFFLEVNTSSLGQVYGGILINIEEIIKMEKPDAFLVLGDTNSAISAIIAKRYKIPVFHMEAGNRCFDMNVPEEMNRRMIDHISDFNLVYTEHARRHLIAEGLPHRRIYLTGSPMKEVLTFYREGIENSKILQILNLESKKYFLVSAHREENVDDPISLKILIETVEELTNIYKVPVIFSTHPRTQKKLNQLKIKTNNNIHFLKPFGFFDFVKLQINSLCTLSDSGTISEESSILNFPAVTIRDSIERPESLDTGAIILSGVSKDRILEAVRFEIEFCENELMKSVPVDYQIENTSLRVLKLILGLAGLNNKWHGIKKALQEKK